MRVGVHALSARPFVSGWAALECGTLTSEPASAAGLVSTTRTFLHGMGWEWKSEARVGIGLGTLLGPEASVATLLAFRGGEGVVPGFKCGLESGHVSGWVLATARVLRTSQWTRASL